MCLQYNFCSNHTYKGITKLLPPEQIANSFVLNMNYEIVLKEKVFGIANQLNRLFETRNIKHENHLQSPKY